MDLDKSESVKMISVLVLLYFHGKTKLVMIFWLLQQNQNLVKSLNYKVESIIAYTTKMGGYHGPELQSGGGLMTTLGHILIQCKRNYF